MNDRHSRREFMGLTAAGVAGVLARPWIGNSRGAAADVSRARLAAGIQGANPDLVVFNAKIYTMDPAAPEPRHSPRAVDASLLWVARPTFEGSSRKALRRSTPSR